MGTPSTSAWRADPLPPRATTAAGRKYRTRLRSRARGRRDSRDHTRKLDRLGDVVDEINEHNQIDERQTECDGDRQVRHEVSVRTVRHRTERQHGEEEARDKRAERDLHATVADEVAEHPRAELGRSEGERDDEDREHESDDRDHGGCDTDQDLPRRVGRSAVDPGGERQASGVRGLIDFVGDHEEPGRRRRSRSSARTTASSAARRASRSDTRQSERRSSREAFTAATSVTVSMCRPDFPALRHEGTRGFRARLSPCTRC